MSTQILVDAILTRTKRGPCNKVSKIQRRQRVRELYFDQERSIIDIANTLGDHRNTISSDVAHLRNEFNKFAGENEIIDFYYRKKLMFARQRLRLEEKLKTESDFGNWLKIERLLLNLADKEFKIFTKFIPVIKKVKKPNQKEVKKIIRKFAFDRKSFISMDQVLREIINYTKCDVDTAHSILSKMVDFGLKLVGFGYTENYDFWEFGKLCGCITKEEISVIEGHRAKIKQDDQQAYGLVRARYEQRFLDSFGAKKKWSNIVWEKYGREMP